VRRLRSSQPTLGIVVLTMYADDHQLFAALDSGASAFVPRPRRPRSLHLTSPGPCAAGWSRAARSCLGARARSSACLVRGWVWLR
jgi:DNA-binding NarL/FixJ family response regulator